MPILIDGYNLMHAADLMKDRFGPGGLEKARRALLGMLAGSLGDEAARTTVVFDASQPRECDDAATAIFHGIRIEFAAGEDKADAWIEQQIRREPAPKQLVVVSTDHRIRAAAKRRGAESVESEEFLRRMAARRRQKPAAPDEPEEKPRAHAAADSEFWIREFEERIDAQDLREMQGPFADLDDDDDG